MSKVIDALNGIQWLLDDVHNIKESPDQFETFFRACAADCKEAVEEYKKEQLSAFKDGMTEAAHLIQDCDCACDNGCQEKLEHDILIARDNKTTI